MVTDHVDIAVVGILVADEVRVVLSRKELQIVPDEISFVQEVLFNYLFEDVSLGGHCSSPPVSKSEPPDYACCPRSRLG